MGTGGAMALGAGGGLLGGMLLADAMQPDMMVENNYYGDQGDMGGGESPLCGLRHGKEMPPCRRALDADHRLRASSFVDR